MRNTKLPTVPCGSLRDHEGRPRGKGPRGDPHLEPARHRQGLDRRRREARANGFLPFEGLGRKQRYAEVLGHELAHAAWSFADPERARLAHRLQGETEQQMKMLLAARARGLGAELQEHVEELDRLGRVLEEPAEAAEVSIWEELLAGQRPR